MENKYLRITIHDNDFSLSLEWIGELLYEIFWAEDNYPTEEKLPMLKEHIKHLWHSTYAIQDFMRFYPAGDVEENYFNPHLEFVDFADIPDWDNHESIYIPMFDDAKILMR
jgi:hypothetical protein